MAKRYLPRDIPGVILSKGVIMKTIHGALLAVLLLSTCAAPAWAHHSFAAEFDDQQPIRLEGVVAQLDWTNPHVLIYVDVKGTRWMVEAGSPNGLLRRGGSRKFLAEGTHVVIDAYRSKDGSPRAYGRVMLVPDGRKLILTQHWSGAP
jgi:hypothetical protein